MISISISCEENEIPALKELLAGIFTQDDWYAKVGADANKAVVDLGTIKSAWSLRPEERARIVQLHEAGHDMAQIKAVTGITDGRIINGVLARGKPIAIAIFKYYQLYNIFSHGLRISSLLV